MGGLACCVLYIALDAQPWLAWASGGLALIAAVLVGMGAAHLVSDAPRAHTVGQGAEGSAALLAGATLPLLATSAFVMVLAPVGVTTIA
jgi:high-affinity Fe2+/Pb2+ permease